MDEARRNFLTYQVLSGQRYLNIEGNRYSLINPSKNLRLLAEHVYQDIAHDLRFDNLITEEKKKKLLIALEIWGPRDDSSLKKLERYLEDKKVSLFNALYNSDKQKSLRTAIANAKKAVEKCYARRHSLDHMTIANHAASTKKRFIIALCLRDRDNNPVYDEKTFLSADSTILEAAINIVDRNSITIAEFREIAREDPWRTIWSIGNTSCIDLPTSEWTDDQKVLVTFAKMYEGTYQSPECPPDEVFEDDDMFDGWLIVQKRKRETSQNTKHVDNMKGISDKAQEVFVYAPNREDADTIYDLNDVQGRMKIKQREQYIEQHGEVQAIDLPDTKLEVRQQAIQEYKDKLKKYY